MLPAVLLVAMLVAPFLKRDGEDDQDGFLEDEGGFIEMGTIWSLISAVVLALVLVLVVNLLAPDFFQAVADLSGTLSTADLNSTIAEAIADVIAFLIPVGAILSIIAVPFAAFEILRRTKLKKSKSY